MIIVQIMVMKLIKLMKTGKNQIKKNNIAMKKKKNKLFSEK